MLQSNCAILPPLMGTFTSPPKLHFLLPLHWVEVLSPCTQLSAPGPMCSASSPAVAETLPVLLAESAPSTYRCICSTLTHSRFHPSSSPLCLLCFIDVFLSSFFFQYADMMLYLPSLTTNPLLTLFSPSMWLLVPSHKIIRKNIQSAISLLSFYLQPTWMRIFSSFTPLLLSG